MRTVGLACMAMLVACGGGGAHSGDDVTGDDGPPADAHPDDGPGAIGEWTDEPGACPAGYTRADITTVAQLHDDARGDGDIADCYFLHNGTYTETGSSPDFYATRGGTAGHPVVFVGESRDGVIIKGRISLDASATNITLENMTVDLTGYVKSGTFNEIDVFPDNTTLRRMTITGDCMTGFTGGAVEVDGAKHVLIEDNIIEKFGHCNSDGRLDHGVYLGSGEDITIRNNVIRGNSSRGIQLNTEQGHYGTLTTILIERNRIYDNGHRDYEDGLVLNGQDTGNITGFTMRRNLIYSNYFSGIRFTGDVITGVLVELNTFVENEGGSSLDNRSEVNLDEGQPVGTFKKNIFVTSHQLLNECDGPLTLDDNVVMGTAAGACVTNTMAVAPGFTDAANGDFHTSNAAVAAYGAYAQ
ncbi:MAG TPA: right-handed parallel beta-helix repeat-containing protein [Kofleriaceae bacterium]